SWSAATSGLVTASFTLRMKGKPVPLKNGAVTEPGKRE
ncbi:phage tail protein, partial [Morganella morganii subsp. morganii]|nr:phage tail protein [Morganella morganii subsp. morganii]MBT0466856.1 phage tail protein [Morganella morganii subsp. morganii]MBT0481605.1 phage tail protein [Morganella morganii subsp. morganii]MBT0481616.1 phage tail protein [Morganella morganii subsp. morganii]MBT0485194.1 phage tail protein [Morganella morganii subsp. morganii]